MLLNDSLFEIAASLHMSQKIKNSIHKRIKKFSTEGLMLKLLYISMSLEKNSKYNKISLAYSGNIEFLGKIFSNI